MESDIKFDAPWGLSLKLMTAASAVILLGIPAIGLFASPHNNITWMTSLVVIPLMILGVAVFFIIRGYVLADQQLLVQRLGWHSKLSLTNLLSVEFDPEAMRRSLRTFGNGGLFCFAGKFCNKKLGAYCAFATAPELAVVLTFTDRTVVVMPDNPRQFVNVLKKWVSERHKRMLSNAEQFP